MSDDQTLSIFFFSKNKRFKEEKFKLGFVTFRIFDFCKIFLNHGF